MYHYVYRITNIKDKKHYYGKRSCKILPEMDLGIKYFSSSSDKEFMFDQKVNKINYKYKVIKIFDTAEKALLFEIKLHIRFKVSSNGKFYNKAIQTSKKFSTAGVTPSEETRAKLSKMFKGRKMSEEQKRKISEIRKNNMTVEHRQAISKAQKGKIVPQETREKLRVSAMGRVISTETRAKMSEVTKGINNPRAKYVDIYEYPSNKLVAVKVVANVWCKENNYCSGALLETLKRDVTKPACFNYRKKSTDEFNPLSYKGLYVVLSI